MATTWLGQRVQSREQQTALELRRQEKVYRLFIEEASRWYADAYEHDTPQVTNMVNLYALVSRMRVFSSKRVVEQSEKVVRAIIDAYFAPNKTFVEVREVVDNADMNPLREFSIACRDELAARGHRH